ncbi:MAG TPA: hypothetical protein VGC21_12060 [Telluria sp.]|jgi:hypothetical protein
MKKLTILALLALTACSKTAAPEGPLDAGARRICMDTIASRAINKSSVSYQDGAAPVTKAANGQLEMTLKFSAKDEQGMATSMVARCVVSADGQKLINIAVK